MLLAAIAVVWSLARIVRRRQGPFLTEFTTVAMSTGVMLWALKFLEPRSSRGPALENVSTIGFVLFLLAAITLAVRQRRDGT
ncbi:MAG: hypothetical protein IT359_12065 [Gemmatimonadaceae bacterium]|nr:hypothetical protein [Gemmatimonadaceae bacterium]